MTEAAKEKVQRDISLPDYEVEIDVSEPKRGRRVGAAGGVRKRKKRNRSAKKKRAVESRA